jgi:hypothetical protein
VPTINAVSKLTSSLPPLAAIAENTSEDPLPIDNNVTPATDYDNFKLSAIYSREPVRYSSAEVPRRCRAKSIIKNAIGKNK